MYNDWITALEKQSEKKRAAGVPEALITLREKIAYASFNNEITSQTSELFDAVVDALEKLSKA